MDLAVDIARGTGARITVTMDAAEAVSGVDFVHTDVWVSMGEPKDVWTDRVRILTPYQVNAALLDKAGNPAVQVHDLPARVPRHQHRRRPRDHGSHGNDLGAQVTGEVFTSPAAIVFDQAENRLHHQGRARRHPRLAETHFSGGRRLMVSRTDAVTPRGVDTPEPREPWFAQDAERVVAAMETDAERGLSRSEAGARLSRYGPNEIAAEKPPSVWAIALLQLRDPMNIMLVAVVVVSLLIGRGLDGGHRGAC